MGFAVPEFKLVGTDEFEKLIQETQNNLVEGNYQIDGLVFTFNNIQFQNELGETSHHPKYKIAFKFIGEMAVTTVRDIIWQVSRNGILTPVAIVEPVELSGAKIERVTLHNLGYVERFELKMGDKIELIRSGEVIPKFLRKLESSDESFKIPDKCPSCSSKLLKQEIRLVCENVECPGRNLEIILNYVSKTNIYDLSEKRIEELMSHGYLRTIDDLYKLTVSDLLLLQKTKDKMANKVYESIQSKKNLTLQTFFSAIGISGIGEAKIQKIIDAGHDSVEKILALKEEDLIKVESFAEKSAHEFISSVQEKRSLIQRLIDVGLIIESHKSAQGALSGKKFVITGKLNQPRSKIEKWIKDNGGRVLSSVSNEVDYLVTNEKESSSSKFKMAKQLNIPLLDEEELFNLIGV
jgi:DNA ligase (NAD+)